MWWVYIVECADGTYYTGITTDIQRRLNEHNYSFKSAKYTRSRRPVRLVYSEEASNRSEASKRECKIKKLSRQKKTKMIEAKNANNGNA
jgi:putative endonuclease|tara:strand:- start:541 stop:807 length:267 start_codon:yes stop_codon:yes gene_type:complete